MSTLVQVRYHLYPQQTRYATRTVPATWVPSHNVVVERYGAIVENSWWDPQTGDVSLCAVIVSLAYAEVQPLEEWLRAAGWKLSIDKPAD